MVEPEAANADANADAASAASAESGEELVRRVFARLHAEGRWQDVEPVKDAMIREYRRLGIPKSEAQSWAYGEIDKMYPPLPTQIESTKGVASNEEIVMESASDDGGNVAGPGRPGGNGSPDARARGDIPAAWPDLPASASLAADLGWVQAERLRIVETVGTKTVVRLDRARSPAPSWSALAWLETSVRNYAKYIDVLARVASTTDDEHDQVRRERVSIEQVRGLLCEV